MLYLLTSQLNCQHNKTDQDCKPSLSQLLGWEMMSRQLNLGCCLGSVVTVAGPLSG